MSINKYQNINDYSAECPFKMTLRKRHFDAPKTLALPPTTCSQIANIGHSLTMKLSCALLPLALLLPTTSAALGEAEGIFALQGAAIVVDDGADTGDSCLGPLDTQSFDLELVENADTYDKCRDAVIKVFAQAMEAKGCRANFGRVKQEFVKHIDMGGETSVTKYIDNMCEHAWLHQPHELWQNLLNKANPPVDGVEFMDGGGHLNEEIGSLERKDTTDAHFILDFYENGATNKLLTMPEYKVFDRCSTQAVKCCW